MYNELFVYSFYLCNLLFYISELKDLKMDRVSDENVQTILSMGFPSESEVRRALQMAKNDLGEAVAILTNEPPTPYEHMDIDLGDKSGPNSTYGPHLPPTYDEVCNENGQSKVRKVLGRTV